MLNYTINQNREGTIKLENYLINKILSPEYYHEIEGFDARIAASKLNDLSATISEALISIIYSDKNGLKEVPNQNKKYIILRHRIRHAIIDLNNCFDLLLQVPWFLFRIWEHYNAYGDLRSKELKNKKGDIVRNTNNWVIKAEKECSYEKVIKFLQTQTDSGLLSIAGNMRVFYKTFLDNSRKPFTVRTLTNNIKHRSALKLQELYKPYNFSLNLNGRTVSPKELGVGITIPTTFCSADNPEQELGKATIQYSDDMYIDIEYNSGETFCFVDYINKSQYYSFDDIYNEVVAFYNEFQKLCESVYSMIENYFIESTILKANPNNPSSTFTIDEFFAPPK